MARKSFLATLLALCISQATCAAFPPFPPVPQCTFTQRQANFDDLVGSPVAAPPIPQGYEGLYWQSYGVASTINTGVAPLLVPQSPPNYAITFTQQQLSGQPTVTSNYANSTTTSFTLQDFYFGCVIQAETAVVQVPNKCIVDIAGYRGDQQVCTRQFTFTPASQTGPTPMKYSGRVDGCFVDIQSAVVTYTFPGIQSALNVDAAMFLDNVRFVTKSCK